MRSSVRAVAGLFVACVGVVLARGARLPGREPEAAPAPKPLVVCAVPSAMPRTGRAADGSAQGLDVAVVRLVARRLGRPVEFHWCASAACGWNCLPEGRCDVVAGQPLDTGTPHGVAWSVPYAGARFGLVVARAGADARSLDDLRGRRVGVVAGTVPLSEKDHTVVRTRSRE
jgi:ABC-type amino acid transport substrate-binding protein